MMCAFKRFRVVISIALLMFPVAPVRGDTTTSLSTNASLEKIHAAALSNYLRFLEHTAGMFRRDEVPKGQGEINLQAMKQLLSECLTFSVMKSDIEDHFFRTFSAEEQGALSDFYKTAAGKKLLDRDFPIYIKMVESVILQRVQNEKGCEKVKQLSAPLGANEPGSQKKSHN
jgi:hypothetical protein